VVVVGVVVPDVVVGGLVPVVVVGLVVLGVVVGGLVPGFPGSPPTRAVTSPRPGTLAPVPGGGFEESCGLPV
jgi:hypothetical protein